MQFCETRRYYTLTRPPLSVHLACSNPGAQNAALHFANYCTEGRQPNTMPPQSLIRWTILLRNIVIVHRLRRIRVPIADDHLWQGKSSNA
jgi:hypothetical protein